jgi:hypothetical protein
VSNRIANLSVAGLTVLALILSVVSIFLMGFVFPEFHVWRSHGPILKAALFSSLMLLFVPVMGLARFSFGYLLSVPLLLAVTGFVWLSFFSQFAYQKDLARWSMMAALACALAPLLFVKWNIRRPQLSETAISRLARFLMLLSSAVLLSDALYGTAFDYPDSQARALVTRPVLLNYATGIITVSILPYLFAFHTARRSFVLAGLVLLLILAFYPIVVNKTVLFAAVALPGTFLLFSYCEPRIATILIYIGVVAVGLIDYSVTSEHLYAFSYLNLRFVGMPSIAIDHYADFFANRPSTGFCQVSIIRHFFGCAYGELGPALAAVYRNGNLNASFFATEGIASVGFKLTPLMAGICGLILSLGNIVSQHLAPRFVAVSACALVPTLLNVPMTTALVSNGAAILFLLWWLTPGHLSGGK